MKKMTNINTSIALKWSIGQVKKKLEEKPNGGIKTMEGNREEKTSYAILLSTLEKLYEAEVNKALQVVDFCKGCLAFTGKVCIPYHLKNFNTANDSCDFCSKFEPKDG